MTNFAAILSDITDRYRALFGKFAPRYERLLTELATPILGAIACSDAPYHTVEHTVQVMQVGQAILEGKQHYEGAVSPQDWLQMMVALLCHDVGYVKGIFEWDLSDRHQYFDGKQSWVSIAPQATGAALADCHVDRSKAFVATHFGHPDLDLDALQHNIEMTRFPVPHDLGYQDSTHLGGLCRAADLLGQLSDRAYLQKLPALFQEFTETGMHQALGYDTPEALRAGYPDFYWRVVYPYVQPSMRYLSATPAGRKRIAQLYTNLCMATVQPTHCDSPPFPSRRFDDGKGRLLWQEAGFTFT